MHAATISSILWHAMFILAAYCIGSMMSAIIIAKLLHLADPRCHGSGNPGATNISRLNGPLAGALTLACDMLKGAIVVWLAQWGHLDAFSTSCVILAVILGHCFPLFFQFSGGKGIATVFGVLLALHIWLGLACISVWIGIALFSRYASLASIISACITPFLTWHFTHNFSYTMTMCLIGLLQIIKHRCNILNLLNGKEHKIGERPL